MLGWLYRIVIGRFGACAHEWVIYREVAIFDGSRASRPCANRYELKCKKCGDMRKREFWT